MLEANPLPPQEARVPPAPPARLTELNPGPPRPQGRYVLYWMTWARRTGHNHGLEHALHWARELGLGLMVLEALRADYAWASPRLHSFVMQGMADTRRRLAGAGARVLSYVEPAPGAGRGLLAALAQDAALVVADQYPAFFIPRMLAAAAQKIDAPLTAVDSCGLIPLAAPGRWFPNAYSMRRWLQKELLGHLAQAPDADPLAKGLPPAPRLPRAITNRWPPARLAALAVGDCRGVELPPGPEPAGLRGGEEAGQAAWRRFLAHGLDGYAQGRNQPGAASGLSPYLHFGHLSPHQVFAELAAHQSWAPHLTPANARGARRGWWGMSEDAEAFVDQLVTWRELGYGFCHQRGDAQSLGLLPDWARKTLAAHAGDQREHLYAAEQFEAAATHDALWNACQRQLMAEGKIEGYLRMLWGKKILEWSPSPEAALATMTQLNNRWALDGRDPNSFSGIMWCLGLFDRAFGPRRRVMGTVRYMASANTQRKLKLADYLRRFGG